ncbi:MAG: hypothetical protein AVDCRST_MAG93-8799, partial [uncultured Chloroflexia bacterium]
ERIRVCFLAIRAPPRLQLSGSAGRAGTYGGGTAAAWGGLQSRL